MYAYFVQLTPLSSSLSTCGHCTTGRTPLPPNLFPLSSSLPPIRPPDARLHSSSSYSLLLAYFNTGSNSELDVDSKEEEPPSLGLSKPSKPRDPPSLLGREKGEVMGEVVEALGLWWWQFRCVLARNARNTVRNPGNLLARTFLIFLIACMQVLQRTPLQSPSDPSDMIEKPPPAKRKTPPVPMNSPVSDHKERNSGAFFLCVCVSVS